MKPSSIVSKPFALVSASAQKLAPATTLPVETVTGPRVSLPLTHLAVTTADVDQMARAEPTQIGTYTPYCIELNDRDQCINIQGREGNRGGEFNHMISSANTSASGSIAGFLAVIAILWAPAVVELMQDI